MHKRLVPPGSQINFSASQVNSYDLVSISPLFQIEFQFRHNLCQIFYYQVDPAYDGFRGQVRATAPFITLSLLPRFWREESPHPSHNPSPFELLHSECRGM